MLKRRLGALGCACYGWVVHLCSDGGDKCTRYARYQGTMGPERHREADLGRLQAVVSGLQSEMAYRCQGMK